MSTPNASRSTRRLPCRRQSSRLSRVWRLICSAYANETLHSDRIFATEDAKEGPRAFAEKRPPKWQGRCPPSAEAVEALRIQPADFRACVFADVRTRAQMFG